MSYGKPAMRILHHRIRAVNKRDGNEHGEQDMIEFIGVQGNDPIHAAW
jgi:hypothetical protein